MSQTSSAPTRRVIFVNRYFHPDHSATAQLLTDVATHLAARGWNVQVVTGRRRYGADGLLPSRENHKGVEIIRVWDFGLGRGSLAARAVDSMTFLVTAFLNLLRFIQRGDLVVAKTDPPLLGVVVAWAARIRGARTINWLQDLYPEVASALGLKLMEGPVGAALRIVRNRGLRSAATNVVIGELMAERLRSEGIGDEQIAVIPNWTDDLALFEDVAGTQSLRRSWGFKEDDFVIGYSGNLGRAHEWATMFAAAKRLRGEADVRFLFIGDGHHLEALKSAVASEGLTSFLFQPYQPRERLAQSLAVADLHWISLRPQLEGLIVPSKFFGVAATRRPVLAVAAADGELGRLISRFACGAVVEPGDSEGLADVLMSLRADPSTRRTLGLRARAMLDAHFTRSAALGRWVEVLNRNVSLDRR